MVSPYQAATRTYLTRKSEDESYDSLEEAIEIGNQNNKKVIYSAPRIIRNKEYNRLNKIKDLNGDYIQIGTLGSIEFFSNKNLCIDYYAVFSV